MYSLQKAAALLGRSEHTIKRWMNRYDIKRVLVETDRRRVYISDNDMKTLTDHIYQKVTKDEEKTEIYNKTNREVITNEEGKYYSLASVASLLGVSVVSVKKWSRQDHIEKKLIVTDKKRAYIAYDDVLLIAELHGCKVSSKLYEDTDIQGEINAIEHDMDELCSIKEVALYLNVSHSAVRRWIGQANIEKKTKFVGREIACITYRDVLLLAELHRCAIVPNASSLTVKEEIKVIKGKLKELAVDIEDIKHDFRLYVKRSIYIG
jgi:transposase